jgi:hypothetical protein
MSCTRNATNRRQRQNGASVELKMIVPALYTWIEKGDELATTLMVSKEAISEPLNRLQSKPDHARFSRTLSPRCLTEII